MTEHLKTYTSEEQDLFVQFDKVATVADVIKKDQEYLDKGGKLIFFNIAADRSLIVDRKMGDLIIRVSQKMFDLLIDQNFQEEATDILRSKQNEGV